MRDRLRADPELRRFHDGKSERLPGFYAEKVRRQLGRYAELLTPDDLRPHLVPGRAMRAASVAAAAGG